MSLIIVVRFSFVSLERKPLGYVFQDVVNDFRSIVHLLGVVLL